jgi:hypothetical protein
VKFSSAFNSFWGFFGTFRGGGIDSGGKLARFIEESDSSDAARLDLNPIVKSQIRSKDDVDHQVYIAAARRFTSHPPRL